MKNQQNPKFQCKTFKILKNSHFEKKSLVFLNYVNNRKPNRAKKKIS